MNYNNDEDNLIPHSSLHKIIADCYATVIHDDDKDQCEFGFGSEK